LNTESEKQLRAFRILYELAIAMTADHGLDENLQLIADKSRELLDTDTAFIALRDEARDTILMHTVSGIRTNGFERIRLRMGKGLGGLVAKTKRGYIIEDYLTDTNISRAVDDTVAREGLVSGIAVPIQIGQKNLGVIYVFNRGLTAFDQSDMDTLFLIGNLAAVEITRKQTEENLRHSEEKYRSVMEASGEPIVVYDKEGRVVYLNPAFSRVFGWTLKELLGLRIPYVPEDNWPETRAGIREVLTSPVGYYTFESRRYTKTGEILDIIISASAYRNRDGTYLGMITNLRDITARKRAEEALRESEEKYRTVMEASGEPMVVYDTTGRVMYLNPAFTRVFGWALDEVLGKRTPYVPEENWPETKAAIEDVFKAPEGYSGFESRRSTKDGQILDVIINASAYRDEEGTPLGMIVNLKDITARKRDEMALAKSEKQLRQLSSQLLNAQETERKRVAQELHDGIGQALTGIRFGLANAMGQADEHGVLRSVESLEALMPVIHGAIEEVRRISMDLRPYILDDLGILATFNWCCRVFQSMHSGIGMEKDIDVEEREVPESMKVILFRVLQEALNNVVKHSGASLVNVCLRRNDRGIELIIRDNGTGFDPETALGDKSLRGGFGLASMKERVQLSGGRFSVQTEVGSGTTVGAFWQEMADKPISK
jgi:PAS domain S-box-containing protein